MNLEASTKRISFIGMNASKNAKTRYVLEKEQGLGQSQKIKSMRPGEGSKILAGSPQKKMEDKKEQERMRKILLSHDISEQQMEELSKYFDDPVKRAKYLESFNLISNIQKRNQDQKVIHRHGFQRIQKILDQIKLREQERMQVEVNESRRTFERDSDPRDSYK